MCRLFETRDDGKYYLILIKSCVGDGCKMVGDSINHDDSQLAPEPQSKSVENLVEVGFPIG